MNNVTRLAFIAFLFFFSFGCANNPGQHSAQKEAVNPQLAAEDSLRDVVFEIHDAVMPKMAEINRLQRELRKWKEAHPGADPQLSEQLLKTLDWLTKADEGMMNWMAEFKQPTSLRDTLSHEAIMNYLAAEQEKVQAVYDDINGSIEAAKGLLQNLNAKK